MTDAEFAVNFFFMTLSGKGLAADLLVIPVTVFLSAVAWRIAVGRTWPGMGTILLSLPLSLVLLALAWRIFYG
jgi:hypothetical protein